MADEDTAYNEASHAAKARVAAVHGEMAALKANKLDRVVHEADLNASKRKARRYATRPLRRDAQSNARGDRYVTLRS